VTKLYNYTKDIHPYSIDPELVTRFQYSLSSIDLDVLFLMNRVVSTLNVTKEELNETIMFITN
jgi:hypothetical protein